MNKIYEPCLRNKIKTQTFDLKRVLISLINSAYY